MSANPDRLYDLMPVVYRMRDAQVGYPLRDFLRVMTTQVNLLEADITRLYNNWFIETCDDWVVPYIGDLLGYSLLPEAQALGEDGAPAAKLGRVLAPRADVANTIDARRRKGTLALLDDLARDAADWPARAVEFYRLLGWMQHLDHQHRSRGGMANVRDPGVMQRIRWANGAFDPLAHSVDIRRMSSHHRRGRYGVPDLGLFVFRLRSYPVTVTAAYCVEDIGPHCYTFSVLGNDTPLFQRPESPAAATTVTQESELPVPLRRYRFAERGPLADYASVSEALYGDGKSVLIYAPDWPSKGQGLPVPREALMPADLSGWHYQIPKGRVAVDPERGRLMFPANTRPKHGVWVSYQYGFAANLGGGEYARTTPELENATRYVVHTVLPTSDGIQSNLPPGHFASISDALAAWSTAKAATPGLRALVIELAESGVYDGSLDLQLAAGEAIQLRAADRTRPVLRLLDVRANQQDALSISGAAGSRFLMDGLLIIGRGVEVHAESDDTESATPTPDLCELVIRHCTLVPGWTLQCECDPKRPGEPSVTLDGTRASLRVEHSIIGPISVISPPRRGEPPLLQLCDSVLDATGIERVAIGAPDEAVAYVNASIRRCTVIGEVQAHSIQLAEDSIFVSLVRVLRRQLGCMRFCFVPTGSRTPQRFHCQPDLATAAVPQTQRASGILRVVPLLRSLRYARPDYVRLHDACCEEIRSGASDGSAMGVYHDLYEPQREANLALRLQEYVPANTDAGILYAS
ncbi:hypothetical protein [Dyella japonica]|uniref:Uncharacterized protein n=1 Tax=Dyella japonica DSM 16301 TaxID=1440762 RepID=A0A0G9HAB3_9GAMM|nr:hypothetical protein [Dyella japonica]KLD66159.1 hypothetical protein Y882_00320 [Dyella japonica DSM 16301]